MYEGYREFSSNSKGFEDKFFSFNCGVQILLREIFPDYELLSKKKQWKSVNYVEKPTDLLLLFNKKNEPHKIFIGKANHC